VPPDESPVLSDQSACPECKGEKTVDYGMANAWGDAVKEWCDTCKGSGVAAAPPSQSTGDLEDDRCPRQSDGQHCRHWDDGGPCCACDAPEMTEAQKREQGMLDA
jgi:hypothetical protein